MTRFPALTIISVCLLLLASCKKADSEQKTAATNFWSYRTEVKQTKDSWRDYSTHDSTGACVVVFADALQPNYQSTLFVWFKNFPAASGTYKVVDSAAAPDEVSIYSNGMAGSNYWRSMNTGTTVSVSFSSTHKLSFKGSNIRMKNEFNTNDSLQVAIDLQEL